MFCLANCPLYVLIPLSGSGKYLQGITNSVFPCLNNVRSGSDLNFKFVVLVRTKDEMQTQIAGCAKVNITSISFINLHIVHLRRTYFDNNKKKPIDKVQFNSVPHCFEAPKLCHKSRWLYFVHRLAYCKDPFARVLFAVWRRPT